MKIIPDFKLNYFDGKPMLYYYFNYMVKRQEAFLSRYFEKNPRPWSDDPILQNYKFTNVFKPLDRGTRWLLENIIHNPSIESEEELLWNIFIYKWFNSVETAETIGLPLSIVNFDYKKFYETLLHAQSKHTLFTTAHMVCGSNVSNTEWGRGPGSKPKTYTWAIDQLRMNISNVLDMVKSSPDMESLFKSLTQFKLVGKFLAYELVIDINYSHLTDFCENSWANPGPGCINGINWTFANIKDEQGLWMPQKGNSWGREYKTTITQNRPTSQYIELMRWCQVNHRELFEFFKLDFPYMDGLQFNMQVIEFNFCEFSKYARALLDCGAPKNTFTPMSQKSNLGDLNYDSHFTGEYSQYPLTKEQKQNRTMNRLSSRTVRSFNGRRDYNEYFEEQ